MTTIVTRAGKGSPLTHTEVDTNFTNLNTNKFETAAIPLGTLAAPSISFVGDANTGAYSPGADTLAFVTAGSNRVHITSAGLVGIGSSAPAGFSSNILHVNGATGSELHLTTGGTGAAAGDGLTLFTRDSDGAAGLFQRENASLLFGTNDNTRVTITSGGLVGIGTTSPAFRCQIDNPVALSGSGNDYALVAGNTSSASRRAVAFGVDGVSGNPVIAGYNTISPGLSSLKLDATNLEFRISGTEKAAIDGSGRLLVGTSTDSGPTALVEVAVGGQNAAQFGRYTSSSIPAYVLLTKSRSDTKGSHTIVQNNDGMGAVSFLGSDGTQFVESVRITAEVDGTPGADDMPGRLVFSTCPDSGSSPTERMRISANGSVQIGRTGQVNTEILALQNAGEIGYFYQTSNSNVTGITMRHTYAQSAQTAKMISFTRDNGTEVGAITSTTTATAYGTSSDYRLKENVVAVNDGIIRLQQLKPSRFNFIVDPDKTVDGFIAHEVQSVVPEAITGEKDAADDDGNPVYQGIDQSKLVPLLTAALQEAIAKIESLEARLTAAGI